MTLIMKYMIANTILFFDYSLMIFNKKFLYN